ncbi:MAG: putative membrane protein [Cognaticolwellia sp.]|jgi:putative membrane protein
MRLYITVILFLILLAIAFVFGSQNDQILTLNYLIAKTNLSVAAAVSLFTSIGFVLGLLFAFFWKLLSMVKASKNNQLNTEKKS